eukprot:Nitzschia sp. Nitz4//scaffold38_size140716//36126//39532//NITZ4_003133-RA/size140716-processed-gene-0.57-mRNA-1//-1//CDS//3329550036//8980//frame0
MGGKRRRGKQSSGRTTSQSVKDTSPQEEESNDEEMQVDQNPENEETEVVAAPPTPKPKRAADEFDLVLTSEKRRGVYECDYCHSDISQLPRIRCAVCPDFDLCLDCFATTDHSAAIARLKAADTAHAELKADGVASTFVAGMSSAVANHDDTHGYRVCDSTRFPLFGTTRFVSKDKSNNNDSQLSAMEESEEGTNNKEGDPSESATPNAGTETMVITEDPKALWTAEEDLRLLDAIKTHGLGNWTDISDAIAGCGSVGKTPKRCMERYLDDFLGRYGHILPQYTVVDGTDEDEEGDAQTDKQDPDDESVRSSKRRLTTPSRPPAVALACSVGGGRARKSYKVVQTGSLPGYDKVWPCQFIPAVEGKSVQIGQEVGRDLSTKNELAFVKASALAATKEDADKIREDWIKNRMNKVGAPTVLPPRPEDSSTLPGADLLGFMPRRGDFDVEYENEAETSIADMEFTTADSESDRQLKVQVLQIYYQKQVEREKRKKFLLSRNLFDYRKNVKEEQELPQDERDLVHRMRLFERFHTPQEHKQFVHDILKAKKLRKEIAKLQMYRRIGIRSLAEAEQYELDKHRRQFHSDAKSQKSGDDKQGPGPQTTSQEATSGGGGTSATPKVVPAPGSTADSDVGDSLWKQYRTSKVRRSLNRMGSGVSDDKSDDKTSDLTENQEATVKETVERNAKDVGAQGPTGGTSVPEQGSDVVEDMQTDGDGDNPDSKGAEEAQSSEMDTGNVEQGVETAFDISVLKGFSLLTKKEADLCTRLKLFPLQYLEIKKALIHESLCKGLLEKEGPGTSRYRLQLTVSMWTPTHKYVLSRASQMNRMQQNAVFWRGMTISSDDEISRQEILDEAAALTKSLYRVCLRSVKVIRWGNEFDEMDFAKREQDFLKPSGPSGTISLAPPPDKEDELRSRAEYYHSYIREYFFQESDSLSRDPLHERDVTRYLYYLRKGEKDRRWLLGDMMFSDPFKDAMDYDRIDRFEARALKHVGVEKGGTKSATAKQDETEQKDDFFGEDDDTPAWFQEKFPHVK